MTNHEEKRQSKRYEYKCSIDLYQMDGKDYDFYAEIKDFSKDGLAMVCNKELVVGNIVYLTMETEHASVIDSSPDNAYYGYVKWVNPDEPADGVAAKFKCGLEFSKPDMHPHQLDE